MHVPANHALTQAATRAERKKLLLLQGALYRLELSAAATHLKQGFGAHPLTRLIGPGLLRLADKESLLPVLMNVLPLVTGKGTLSVWLRRAAIMASAGWFVLAALRRKRDVAETFAENADAAPEVKLAERASS